MLSPRARGPRACGQRQRGFSLIEIVVTIAVLALLLFAAVPSIAGWLDNTRIRNVTDSLQNGLQLARAEAVRRNEEMSFWLVGLEDPGVLANTCTLSASSASWVVSVYSPVKHCADEPSTVSSPKLVTAHAVGEIAGRVTVSALRSDGDTAAVGVTFNGFGRVTNADAIAQIDISGASSDSGARNLRIAISPAGQVRLCDRHVTDDTDPRKC